MKLQLTIKKADGSQYWIQKFSSLVEGEAMRMLTAWLDAEKLRPYWNPEFTTEILDVTPQPHADSPDEVARKAAILQLKTRLLALDDQVDLTAAELKEMARKFFKLLKLKGFID